MKCIVVLWTVILGFIMTAGDTFSVIDTVRAVTWDFHLCTFLLVVVVLFLFGLLET